MRCHISHGDVSVMRQRRLVRAPRFKHREDISRQIDGVNDDGECDDDSCDGGAQREDEERKTNEEKQESKMQDHRQQADDERYVPSFYPGQSKLANEGLVLRSSEGVASIGLHGRQMRILKGGTIAPEATA